MLSGTQMPDAADGRSTRRIQAGREVVRDGPPVLPDLGWIARNEVEQPRVEGEGAALLPPVDPTRARDVRTGVDGCPVADDQQERSVEARPGGVPVGLEEP